MPGLTATALIDVWDRFHSATPVRRALALLAASTAEREQELARLSVGARDRRLLDLREGTFGSRVTCQPVCPACGERLESTFEIGDIRVNAEPPTGPFQLESSDYTVDARLPDSTDLIAIESAPGAEAARVLLLDRCVVRCIHEGSVIDWRAAPEHVLASLTDRMNELDPQANTRLSFACPACGNQWVEAFDIVSFFWAEISVWAKRLLREVHALASVYGWRESDILAMSALRRQVYLELVGR
jgi:predicted RNA-binding Zn-ribbon protein involved in translation (DUF1610 family)